MFANFALLLSGVNEVGRWSIGESWSTFEWTSEMIRKDYTLKIGSKHKCKICGDISNRSDQAAQHVLLIHLAGQTKCPLCDKMGTRKTLTEHVRKDHNMSMNMYSMKLTEKRT